MRTVFLLLVLLSATSLIQISPVQASPSAQDATYSATCEDGRVVVGTRYTFYDLNREAPHRFTLMGVRDFNPVVALIDEDGIANCSEDEGSAVGSQVAIPGAGLVDANAFSTQRTFRPRPDGALQFIVGGYLGETGQYVFVLEGLLLDSRTEEDRLAVDVPPAAAGEVVGVYMFGQTQSLDPLLEMKLPGPSQQPLISCDNAGTADCPDMLSLVDNGALLENGGQYVGDAADAGILTPITLPAVDFIFKASRQRSQGSYGAVVTGIAPGSAVDPRLLCTDVATKINGVSSTYSSLYPPENILDGDHDTIWATSVGETDPTTEEPVNNVFVVIGFEGTQRIDRIRIDGYAPDPRYRSNSTRKFEIVLNNASDQVVTAFQGELRLHTGFQEFQLLPVEVEELGLVLKTNSGGDQFILTEVQVCAAQ